MRDSPRTLYAMPVYRDDRSALRLRAEALRREVERCEERVTPAFWRCIPTDDAEALRALRSAGEGGGTDDAALTARCDALERYARRFDRVLAELDRHESEWRHIPEAEVIRASSPHGLRAGMGLRHVLSRAFIEAAKAIDADARIESFATEGDYSYALSARAELRIDGAPVTLQLSADAVSEDTGEVRSLRAATTVPRGLPELLVRPETWTESLFRGLRLRRDESLGDPRFDSFFHAECEAGAASQVLGAEVRAALLVIATVDVPTLRVKPPEATLTWRFAPTLPTLSAAARCMAAIRSAPVLPLLKR